MRREGSKREPPHTTRKNEGALLTLAPTLNVPTLVKITSQQWPALDSLSEGWPTKQKPTR